MRSVLVLCVAMVLGGCAMGGFVTVSEPKLLPGSASYAREDVPGVFRVGEMTVSVKPQNADVSLLTAGVIVPLVPLGSGNKVRAGKPFELVLQFDHPETDYSFTPASLELTASSGKVFPVSLRGPLTRTDLPRELEKASFGHSWVCRDEGRTVRVEELTEVDIPPRSCLVVQFVSSTLSPQEEFRVQIAGLKKKGVPLPHFEVQFKPTQRATGSWLGGM